MSIAGENITGKVTTALNALDRDDVFYYGKQNALKRISAICGFYEFGDNCKLYIGGSLVGLVFLKGNTNGIGGAVIKILYDNFNMAYLSYGEWEAEFPATFSNLLEIIDFVDNNDIGSFILECVRKFINEGLITTVRYIGDKQSGNNGLSSGDVIGSYEEAVEAGIQNYLKNII